MRRVGLQQCTGGREEVGEGHALEVLLEQDRPGRQLLYDIRRDRLLEAVPLAALATGFASAAAATLLALATAS